MVWAAITLRGLHVGSSRRSELCQISYIVCHSRSRSRSGGGVEAGVGAGVRTGVGSVVRAGIGVGV